MVSVQEFNPNIIAFACQWCAYECADLVGSLKYSYPASVKIVRIPCSGRVDAAFIIEAFKMGADGVIVGGCPKNECHYRIGNKIAYTKVNILKNMLPEFGIEAARLEFVSLSSSDVKKFVEFVTNFDRLIRKIGPSPIRRFGNE